MSNFAVSIVAANDLPPLHARTLQAQWWPSLSSIYTGTSLEGLSLTHWGRVSNLTIIGSYDGLALGKREAIIWTNAGILLIGPLGTNFSEIVIEMHTFPFKKMHGKMLSVNCGHFVLALMC